MPRPLKLHEDRLLPAEPATRSIARALYERVEGLPIVSPHGHTDPAWFAGDTPWAEAHELAHELAYGLVKRAYRIDQTQPLAA